MDNDSSMPASEINLPGGDKVRYYVRAENGAWTGDYVDVTDEVAGLRAERARQIADADITRLALHAKVIEVGRERDALRAERDSIATARDVEMVRADNAEAEVERMRPVVEAVYLWMDMKITTDELARVVGQHRAASSDVTKSAHSNTHDAMCGNQHVASSEQETTDCPRCQGCGYDSPHGPSERDYRAELTRSERMRPVVEAAEAFRDGRSSDTGDAAEDAVDAYREAARDQG